MDELLKSLFFQFGLFCTACYALTTITRRFVEAGKPTLKQKDPYTSAFSRWWNEALLYAVGPVWGIVLALCIRNTEFFPQDFRVWTSSVVFGLACGFISSFVYKLFKKALAKEANVEVDVDTDSP